MDASSPLLSVCILPLIKKPHHPNHLKSLHSVLPDGWIYLCAWHVKGKQRNNTWATRLASSTEDRTHTHIHTLLWQKQVTEGVPRISDKCAVRGQSPWSDSCSGAGRMRAIKHEWGKLGSIHSANLRSSHQTVMEDQWYSSPDFRVRKSQQECLPQHTLAPLLLCCGHVNLLWHFLMLALEAWGGEVTIYRPICAEPNPHVDLVLFEFNSEWDSSPSTKRT